MVVRGVYTKAEEAMLAEWRERTDKLIGWLGETPSEEVPYPVFHRVASKDLILHMAYAADYWNPLWRDEVYARNTRWGGIIAPPFFQLCISHGGPHSMKYLKVTPEVGVFEYGEGVLMRIREDWEFLKPIYVNDSFKVWVGRPEIEDVTIPQKSANRKFKITYEISYINQRNEVTGIFRTSRTHTILPSGTETKKKEVKFAKEYVYTREDIEAIDRVFEAEEIRGAKIRWWEDVNVGDELKPVVMGPVTVWDQVVEMQGFGVAILPMIEVRRQTPGRVVIDPVTNIPHKTMGFHLSERISQVLGAYSSNIMMNTLQHLMGRLVTNWMGDDGFLRRVNLLKLNNHPLGDTLFGRGKVKKKYISANGEYLVDLEVWVETIRGYVSDVATATVSLISRENPLRSMGIQ